MRRLALLLLALALAGCHHAGANPDVVVTPGQPKDSATCLDYCRHGQQLGCDWARPTPAGATCVDVCAHFEEISPAPWDLTCRTASPSCAAPGCQ